MGEPINESNRFGRYLRQIREDRKLSLDAVEEMTSGYPERVTKSHLCRIENGQAMPTFPRMFALSQVYGVPIATLAESFESDLYSSCGTLDIQDKSPEEVQRDAERQIHAGNYLEALSLVMALRERYRGAASRGLDADQHQRLLLYQIDCLIHLERYESAKIECEQLLCGNRLAEQNQALAMQSFVICCYRLKRFTIAQMAIERAERELEEWKDHPTRIRAKLVVIRGAILHALGRKSEAAQAFKKALELYRLSREPYEACRAQVNLAQSLIDTDELDKAATHLRSALKVAEDSGYDRLQALALSHLALVAHRNGDGATAESYLLRSNAIARPREYLTLVFRNCYYLRKIAEARGDSAGVASNERTLKTFISRVDSDLPEAVTYRAELVGGGEQ